MPHDLSHSQLILIGFQINPLSHISLSINSFIVYDAITVNDILDIQKYLMEKNDI